MKVFFSYTTRYSDIDTDDLYNIKVSLNANNIDSYIDLLDNKLGNQQAVILELMSSDVLCLIKTRNVLRSPWVRCELNIAQENGLKIIEIPILSKKDFNNIIRKNSIAMYVLNM